MSFTINQSMTSPTALFGRLVTPDGVRDGVIHLDGDRISRVEMGRPSTLTGSAIVDLDDHLIYPGFINLHVHGALGMDFTDRNPATPAEVAGYLTRQGWTGFLATYLSCPTETLLEALTQLRSSLATKDPRMGAVLGVHLEGPFLNPLKKGAHPEECLRMPLVELLDTFLDAVPKGLRTVVTMATELPGGLDLAKALIARGGIPALGHSKANCAQALAAIEAGVRHAIHLFCAMDPMHHREPGIPGAFLTTPGTFVEIIPDLVHIHPRVVKLVLAARGPEGIILITDSLAPTGLGDGEYSWTGRTLRVHDGKATLPDGTLAGSVLETQRMLKIMADLGAPPPAIAQMLSTNPATVLGLADVLGQIAPGRFADLTVVDNESRPVAIVKRGVLLPCR